MDPINFISKEVVTQMVKYEISIRNVIGENDYIKNLKTLTYMLLNDAICNANFDKYGNVISITQHREKGTAKIIRRFAILEAETMKMIKTNKEMHKFIKTFEPVTPLQAQSKNILENMFKL